MKVLIVALAYLLCCSQVHAQETAGTFRSGVDLVSLNVIVTDNKDKFVTGLTQKDFVIFEDGIPQDVSFFAAANVPLDMAILLDTSSSMSDKIATVQEAAVGFASHLRENDRITVIGIKDTARTLHDFDGDGKGACDAIRKTSAGGGTALYNALYTTIKQMQKVHAADGGEIRRQAIIVLSDGEDTSSLLPFEEVLDLAKRSETAIYTVGLRDNEAGGGSKTFKEAEYVLKQLAQQTGGRAFFPNQLADLNGVYGQISDELSSQYTVGYTSKNPKRDGAWRRVVVQVARPGVAARTKLGYFGPTR
jgi:Ca-activated chloride channel family protein